MDRLSSQTHLLIVDLEDIHSAIVIFNAIDDEIERRVKQKVSIGYCEIRTIVRDSLVYRSIIGLSKLFASSKEYSVEKLLNQIEQSLQRSSEIQRVITNFRNLLSQSQMIPIIKSFRDKFFAHLDRESVYSHFRVDAGEAMKVVDLHELDTYISLIRELYTVCFGDLKMPKRQMPSQEHIMDTFF